MGTLTMNYEKCWQVLAHRFTICLPDSVVVDSSFLHRLRYAYYLGHVAPYENRA